MSESTAGYLVTGASGFIGHAVCARLLAAGARVDGVSRSAVELDHPGYRHWQADMADADTTDALFEKIRPRYAIHLAGCVSGRRELEWVRETVAGNLLSTVNLLVAAQANGVEKCVLAGSLEEPSGNIGEPVPSSPYAASKWAASGYARMFHALYDQRVAVARVFMVYGPGQKEIRKLIPYVCLSAAKGERPQLMSGTREIDWLYIDDAADGLLALAEGGPDDGTYVDIGTGVLTSTAEIARRVCAQAGGGLEPELGAVADRRMEQVRRADAEATERLLGWRPGTGLEDGLRQTYDWYRQAWQDGRFR